MLPLNEGPVHFTEKKENILPHCTGDPLVFTEPGDLAVWDISDNPLRYGSTASEQVERINVELQSRKEVWSVLNPLAYRPFLPVSDFEEGFLVLTYLQPVGKNFD